MKLLLKFHFIISPHAIPDSFPQQEAQADLADEACSQFFFEVGATDVDVERITLVRRKEIHLYSYKRIPFFM